MSDAGPRLSRTQRTRLWRWIGYGLLAVVGVLALVFVDWGTLQENFFDPEIARDLFPEVITEAARATLIFSTLGFSIAFALGLLLSVMKLSPVTPYRWLATIYIEVFRGLPALVTILFVGFGLPLATGFRLPGTWTTGAVALGIVGSAYIAETLRAGIQAVPPGQVEAARSLGMKPATAFLTVTLPQALRVVLPPLTNEFVLLLKDSSLLFFLGTTATTKELAKFGRDASIEQFNSTPLIVVGLVYLAITVPLTQVAAWIERRLSTR